MRMVPRGLLPGCALVAMLAIGGCGDGIDDDLARDGLHVEDLEAAPGTAAERGDHVRARILAWEYRDGERGAPVDRFPDEPISLHLVDGEVVAGLLEGIVGMGVGGRRRIVIATEERSAHRGPDVPEARALWCEVELLDIARVEVEDLEVGEGRPVDVGDYVEIDYQGWHADSTGRKADRFISSTETGEPAGVLVGSGMVNEGLDRGLLGMRIGGVRRIVVPPALGYGDRGLDTVRPGATLVYEVEALRTRDVEWETLAEGDGAPLADGQTVRFHLAGWVAGPEGDKGARFQDSRTEGEPFATVLGSFEVQPGLALGMRGMRPGEVRRIHVPAVLAFGGRGWHRGPRTLVPPDADVIYEVEVLPRHER